MQEKRYEILDGLPAYGDMYIPVAPDGVAFYSEGFVVRFCKSDGTSWVANFKPGLAGFSGVYDFPEFKRTIVFAFGHAYIMTDNEQTPLNTLGAGITNVFQADDNILIAADYTNFAVIEISSDAVWHSERVSWDGFKNLELSGDCLTGLAYELTGNESEWLPFLFNYRTKDIVGGAYHPQPRKPWWRFW